jgi:hypothetical protein
MYFAEWFRFLAEAEDLTLRYTKEFIRDEDH